MQETSVLTVSEAAAYAGVDISTIRLWCDNGRLPHSRTPGGHRRIRAGDLTALLRPPAVRARRDPGAYPVAELLQDVVAVLRTVVPWAPPTLRSGELEATAEAAEDLARVVRWLLADIENAAGEIHELR